MKVKQEGETSRQEETQDTKSIFLLLYETTWQKAPIAAVRSTEGAIYHTGTL